MTTRRRELLDTLKAAEKSKAIPHPTLSLDIDLLSKFANTLALNARARKRHRNLRTTKNAAAAVLVELYELRAILADKVEESCAADEIRRRYCRDLAAWLLMWSETSTRRGPAWRLYSYELITAIARGAVHKHNPASLAVWYERLDAMEK